MDRLTARDPDVAAAVRAAIAGEVREGEPLARYSTYRIGGHATVVLPKHAEDVAASLRVAADREIPVFVVGLGSNLLFPDEGMDALVIRIGKGLDAVAMDGPRWTIGAGLPGPLAARRSAAAGLAGLHKFVGVPGSVGGGVYMNAGCHGGEYAEVVERITVIDLAGRDRVLARTEIPFRYRRSGLDDLVVVEAVVALREEDPAVLETELAELFHWRESGTPFNQPCCGSVFQNPGGPSWKQREGPRTAGQLIEAAGLKGHRIGGAEVSLMHANYFVNVAKATAADVRSLIRHAQRVVLDRFEAVLEPEVKIIGRWGTYEAP